MASKFSLSLLLRSTAALATVALTTFTALSPANSVTFGQKEVKQSNFIAVASPLGATRYQLFIYEQLSPKRSCWAESGNKPTKVDVQLLTFNFTGICGRNSDSNGYSIRKSGQDLGLQYDLDLVKRGSELVLVGTRYRDRNAKPIEIGRTNGITKGFLKINLDPGWRFTKRTYKDKTLGHVYLTNDR